MPDISSPWRIKEIQEEIEDALKEIHSDPSLEDGLYVDHKLRPRVEQSLKEAIIILDKAYAYAYNIQKLVEGDNGAESFLEELLGRI